MGRMLQPINAQVSEAPGNTATTFGKRPRHVVPRMLPRMLLAPRKRGRVLVLVLVRATPRMLVVVAPRNQGRVLFPVWVHPKTNKGPLRDLLRLTAILFWSLFLVFDLFFLVSIPCTLFDYCSFVNFLNFLTIEFAVFLCIFPMYLCYRPHCSSS